MKSDLSNPSFIWFYNIYDSTRYFNFFFFKFNCRSYIYFVTWATRKKPIHLSPIASIFTWIKSLHSTIRTDSNLLTHRTTKIVNRSEIVDAMSMFASVVFTQQNHIISNDKRKNLNLFSKKRGVFFLFDMVHSFQTNRKKRIVRKCKLNCFIFDALSSVLIFPN